MTQQNPIEQATIEKRLHDAIEELLQMRILLKKINDELAIIERHETNAEVVVRLPGAGELHPNDMLGLQVKQMIARSLQQAREDTYKRFQQLIVKQDEQDTSATDE